MPTDWHGVQTGVVLTTALASFVTGYLFGVFASRGYLISPALSDERRRFASDPVESDASDVDENDSLLDHAPNWANSALADRRQGLRAAAAAPAAPADADQECKLVLVVRTDLGMTKGTLHYRRPPPAPFPLLGAAADGRLAGKIAAQCSHATLACFKALARAAPGTPQQHMLARWEKHGQAKIAVQVKSQDEMLELRRRARALGLTAEVIQDAGRTQIEAGSMTVLGVGPAPRSLVDQVTGDLKLL